jgi:hypothetical protein
MEPFNIKINVVNKEVTLTILPQDEEYKIIYFGGIIGALRPDDDHFKFIKPEYVTPGSLPLYEYKQPESLVEEVELSLTDELLKQITKAIKKAI